MGDNQEEQCVCRRLFSDHDWIFACVIEELRPCLGGCQ
jgi:hypothetical protein